MKLVCKGLVVSWGDSPTAEGVIINEMSDLIYLTLDKRLNISKNYGSCIDNYFNSDGNILGTLIIVSHPYCVGERRKLIDMLNSNDLELRKLALGIIENGE